MSKWKRIEVGTYTYEAHMPNGQVYTGNGVAEIIDGYKAYNGIDLGSTPFTLTRNFKDGNRIVVVFQATPAPSTMSTGPTYSVSEPAAEPLPVIRQEEAIRGYKVARLQLNGLRTDVVLAPMHIGSYFHKPEATAQCLKGYSVEHEVPDPSCSCGFYAAETPEGITQDRPNMEKGIVLMEVDLTGKIISHRLGVRAAHQRILRIVLQPTTCTGWLCEGAPADTLIWDDSKDQWITRCAEHAERFERTLTAGQLAQRLGGIEVKWDAPPQAEELPL